MSDRVITRLIAKTQSALEEHLRVITEDSSLFLEYAGNVLDRRSYRRMKRSTQLRCQPFCVREFRRRKTILNTRRDSPLRVRILTNGQVVLEQGLEGYQPLPTPRGWPGLIEKIAAHREETPHVPEPEKNEEGWELISSFPSLEAFLRRHGYILAPDGAPAH